MGLLSDILRGVRTLTSGGVAVPSRNVLECPDMTLTDDPARGRTIARIFGVGSNPTFGTVTASALVVGPWSMLPQPQATTSGAVTSSVSSVVDIGARQSVRIKFYARAAIFGQSVVATYEQVSITTAARLAGGFAPTWNSGISAETNIPGSFTGGVGAATLTVTGASNSSGQIELTISSAAALIAGQSIVNVAGVGGVSAATGAWVVDSIPDGTHVVLRGTTWGSSSYTSGGTVTPLGAVALTIPATGEIQAQATGLVGAPWQQSEVVGTCALRTTPGGLYLCSEGGTTASSGTGPSGTGAGISDGGAGWEWLSLSPNATVVWACRLELDTIQG